MNEDIKIDYFFIGSIVALTGFEFIFRASFFIHVGYLAIVSFYFFKRNRKFSNLFFVIVSPLLIAFLLQSVLFPNIYISVTNFIGMTVKFLICYMVLEIVKYRINITFVGFMYFLSIVSLLLYPTQFFFGVQEAIKSSIGSLIRPIGSGNIPDGYLSKTLIFFTYHHQHGQDLTLTPRNCGAFWEPGMFAVFLNLAILINIYINRDSVFSRKNIVLITALLTTFSTTGYIVLFLIFISIFILNKKVEWAILYIPIVLIVVLIAYSYVWKMDFMSNKITEQVDEAQYNRTSRFGAAVYHFEILKESPMTGVFLNEVAKDKDVSYENRKVTPNGISFVFLIWGIPAGLLYYVFFYKGLSRWLRFNGIDNRLVHFFFFFIFILSAFSQDVTNRHFYYMILFFVACFPRFPIPKGSVA